MNLSRRGFLGALIAASSVAAMGPAGVALVKEGLVGDVYHMKEGEILRDLYMPDWAKIIMAKNSVITGCYFKKTQIHIPESDMVAEISNCTFMPDDPGDGAMVTFGGRARNNAR